MFQKYLLVWLSLLSLVAWLWPHHFSSVPDPFALSGAYLQYLFATTMFVIGSLLPLDEVRQVFRRWPTVLGGTAIQYVSMPTLAFLIGKVFGLERDLMLGLILVGCVPGAMASNVLTLTARGNISYSVSLTTSATLLSPLIVPVALYLTLQETGVDSMALAKKSFFILLAQVVGPVVFGFLIALAWDKFKRFMTQYGPIFANMTILWIIAFVVNKNYSTFTTAGFSLYAALLLVNIGGYSAGFLGGGMLRLSPGMKRALTLEIGMQNAGLGVVLAGQLFKDQAQVGIPAALYTFGCMLTGTVLAQFFAYRTADESAFDSTGENSAASEPTESTNST
ncbi:MAG: hypothetical protein CMJ78_12180 [Planctomycetaceae bacterium]|nr:hypothetical protein [Planctomycetaceae bacterium]